MNIAALRAALLGVAAYKDLLTQPVMTCVFRLLDTLLAGDGPAALSAYTDLFYALRKENCSGLGTWLLQALRYDDGPYPRLVEAGKTDAALESAAERDVVTFSLLASVDSDVWLSQLTDLMGEEYRWLIDGLPRWESGIPFTFEGLTACYRRDGAGLFARYRAFVWEDGQLIGVSDPDCPTADALLGYDRQREEVLQNTRTLLAGHRVNNILLYGESGTGKSATVKNLLTLPGTEDLRIIEADKENLTGLPALIRSLRDRRHKFIIFIDDLAFDQDDATYSSLKTILEGGMERRPANVAVYATSNRRHLVRQTISERAGDDMDRNETIQEKTALADRFGLRILFLGLSKAEFLALVDMLADRHGITMDREELHRRAVIWERHHTAQTPRTALQFILSLS